MSVYSEPGRGRKLCPECKNYVGVRCSTCDGCGYKFTGNEPKPVKPPKASKPKSPANPPQVHDEGGKGRKQCQSCKKYYGARLLECPGCGAAYVKVEKIVDVASKTFDVGGPGRKQCPKCHLYYGARTSECPSCGATYFKKEVIRTYDSPGRRRKRCPECEVFVSSQAPKCVCDYKFPTTDSAPVVEKPKVSSYIPSKSDVENAEFHHLCGCKFMSIATPAGECPIKLNGDDYESVQKWVSRIINRGHENSRHYAPSALRYWLRSMGAADALDNLAAVLEASRTGDCVEEEDSFLEDILA